MKWKKVIVVFSIVVALLLVAKLMTMAFVEPWLEEKIETTLKDKSKDYKIEIDKVNILFFSRGIELKTIRIQPIMEAPTGKELKLEIVSIRVKGVGLYKFIFNDEIEINEIVISEGKLRGELLKAREEKTPIISSSNITINKVRFQQMAFEIRGDSSPQIYFVKGGMLNIYSLKITAKDTVDLNIIKEFDFKVEAFHTILSDSLYTLKAGGIVYNTNKKKLTVEDFIIHPNYPDYAFTARRKYQTDCVRAIFKSIALHDFSLENFVRRKELVSSFLEVGEMEMHVFRDRRKEFQHKVKPMFQDLIYDYQGKLRIDSVGVTKGEVTYVEHMEQATHPGKVKFIGINAKVYNIDNDTIYKTKEKFLELKGHTYLMGEGKMTIWLKGRLYDPHNTILLSGSLSTMEAAAVNPMLEKNAFLYITSGKVQSINFTFSANKYRAKGKMIMLYEGLNVAVKNKETDDTTAIREKVMSLVANKMIRNSNPEKGEETREGIIEYERDPEKFLFNYCFKSILTGLKSSLSKINKDKIRDQGQSRKDK